MGCPKCGYFHPPDGVCLEPLEPDQTIGEALEIIHNMANRKSEMAQKIRQVVATEPRREGEYPSQFWVGYGNPAVYSIEQVHENCGTYGIEWFVAYDKDNNIIGKMNALAVETVFYYTPEVVSES